MEKIDNAACVPTQFSESPAAIDNSYDYAIKTHEYIKYLNQLTDQRANFLIASSSIILATITNFGFKVAEVTINSPSYWMIISIVASVLASMFFAIRVILPKTFDAASPFHTAAIAQQNISVYVDEGLAVSKRNACAFVLRENHVVSRIVEYKSSLLRRSAIFLILSISIGVMYWLIIEFHYAFIRA